MILTSLLLGLMVQAAEPATNSLDVPEVSSETLAIREPIGDKAQNAAGPAVQKEEQIPVKLEAAKPTSTSESPIGRIFTAVGVMGIMALGGYFLIGKYRRSQIGGSVAPEIKVLRNHYLGPKKSLAIIRVAGESMLIGITDHNISMIKSLALLDEDVPEEVSNMDFNQSLESASEKSFKVTHMPNAENGTETDEYSITGIRDFVSQRLKNMRNLN